jgi:hypothetical protein
MADATEPPPRSRTPEQTDDMDSVSADSFGSTPPQSFRIPGPSTPQMALPQASHLSVSEMDLEQTTDQQLNIPDLDDQYKLTDEEFNAPYNPDREGEG